MVVCLLEVQVITEEVVATIIKVIQVVMVVEPDSLIQHMFLHLQ